MATILVASMDSRAFDSLSSEIMGEGHDVLWASNGKDACDMVVDSGVDLVFLEAALPVFSGFETAELLRGDPDVPQGLPIFLLGDEATDPHRMAQAGFTGQFPKTHSYYDVRELLSSYLRPDVTAL